MNRKVKILGLLIAAILMVSVSMGFAQDGDTPDAIDKVLEDFSVRRGHTITREDLTAWTWESRTFPDASLGCPVEGEAYAQVETPGYQFTLDYDDTFWDYRSTRDGETVVFCGEIPDEEVKEDQAVTPTPEPEPTQDVVRMSIDLALIDLSERVEETIVFEDLTAWEWEMQIYSDKSLGCPEGEQEYDAVETLAYQLNLTYGEEVYDYRVSEDGELIVYCGKTETFEMMEATAEALPSATPQAIGEPIEEDESLYSASYEDVHFSFAKVLASDVLVTAAPATNPGDDAPYWAFMPSHYRFDFVDYVPMQENRGAQILVFPLEEYLDLGGEVVEEEVDHLRMLLDERGDLREEEMLPYLPLANAEQVLHTNEAYLEFGSGEGIRYLTAYRQDAYPLTKADLFYTFQGLTYDDEYYIMAVFPVATDVLPDEVDEDLDYDDFIEGYETYLLETITELDQQAPVEFTPDLRTLDSVITSMTVYTSWENVSELLQTGEVVEITEYTNSLEVQIIRADDRVITTQAPEEGAIWTLVDECGEPCAEVSRMTE